MSSSSRQPQLFARDVRLSADDPLVYLEAGKAVELRHDARAGYLQCPLPGCADPRFTTRGGQKLRDHFVHLARAGGNHGPETLAHHTAKHLIGRYLRRVYPDAEVRVDDGAVDSGARPDVLLRFPTGRRVAYEVQFAALTPQSWQERHRRYVDEQIRDVWLFGGLRYQRPLRYLGAMTDARVIGPTLAAVLAAGHPLLLIDSSAEQVALGLGRHVDSHLVGAPTGNEFVPRWLPLDAARWAQGVIDLPGLRSLLEKAEPGRLKLRARHQYAEEGRRRVKEHERARSDAEVAWRHRRQALESYRGALPQVIDGDLPAGAISGGESVVVGVDGESVELYPVDTYPQAEWRWRVLLLLERHLGKTVSLAQLRQEAFANRPRLGREQSYDALLGDFLMSLRIAGYVWFVDSRGPLAGEGVLILGSADTPPQLKGRYAKYKLTSGPPVTLTEMQTRTILWQSHTELLDCDREPQVLPPGISGRRADRRGLSPR